ncbi:MAG: PAS domain-containing protein [Spirochaetales bacterium]|nr:PAS domain-containing protein [Spirochaetales bacterium]
MEEFIDYEAIFEDIGTGIIIRDAEGRFLRSNKTALHIFGLTRDQFIQISPDEISRQFMTEDGRALIKEEYPPFKAGLTGSIVKDAVICRQTEKGKQWLSVTSIPQISPGSSDYDSVISIFTDISGRKRAEDQLEDSRNFVQLVMDNIPQFIFWKDTDLNYLGCNSNFARVAGVQQSQGIIGKSDYDLAWEEEQAAAFRSDDRRVIESGKPLYHIIEPQLHADGKKAWLDTNKIPLLDADGAVRGILGTYEDITERIQAERELRRLRNYLENILDSMPSVMIGIDRRRAITFWNGEAVRVSGIPEKEAAGRKVEEVLPWLESSTELLDKVLHTGAALQNKRTVRKVGTRLTHEEVTVFPLRINDKIEGAVIRMDDISEGIRLQEQLFQSQKMDAIGQLSSGMAHDFNNILGGIFGAADLMSSSIEKESENGKFLSLIIESAQRASGLVSRLMTFSRSETDYFSLVDTHKIINDAVSILENTLDKRISLVKDLQAEICTVKGDDSQLQTMFLNLAINASHAMPEGGEIEFFSTVTTLDEASSRIGSFKLTPGAYLLLKVSDTGEGIPPEIVSRIFEPFFTTKEQGKGTGLGLSAVYGLIKEMGGAITVYSEPGRGSSFYIYLPLDREGEEQIIMPEAVPVRGEGHVLIVDDEKALRVTSSAILQKLGYQISVTANGQEAVDFVREHPGETDLVLMDMVMPVMSGLDCFRKLRAMEKNLPVILSSGFSHQEDVASLMQEGLNGFIRKPYNAAALSRAVADVFDDIKN